MVRVAEPERSGETVFIHGSPALPSLSTICLVFSQRLTLLSHHRDEYPAIDERESRGET
jgi:hypothetical protein